VTVFNWRVSLVLRALRLSAISTLLIVCLSAGAASGQAVRAAPSVATTSTEDSKEKEYAAAVANCEGMWDRGTHMTREQWSRTCRRVQARLKQMELR
jgi:hypothetical protein